MKIVPIPDPHQTRVGLDFIKENIDKYDKFVVVGDFVDNWESTKWWIDPLHNPVNIIEEYVELKKQHPDKIDLLVGNHDMGYLGDSRISGHQHQHHIEISECLIKNLEHFKAAVQYGRLVFSHAGISDWYVEWVKDRYDLGNEKDFVNFLNHLLQQKQWGMFDYCELDSSGYGASVEQTPLWIRPNALIKSMKKFPSQVVGHTERPRTYRDSANGIELFVIDSPDHDNFQEFEV